MTLTPNQIYTFKLNTGEEIVARLVETNPDHMIIYHPILTVLAPQGLQMMPALFSTEQTKNVRLNNHGCAMIADTREDIRASWIQATTGIHTSPAKQIITG